MQCCPTIVFCIKMGAICPLFTKKNTETAKITPHHSISKKRCGPQPAPFVSYLQFYLYLGKLSRNCYRFLKIVPLDFPAAVYYNKTNFILLKTLRRTTDAGRLSQRSRGRCKRLSVPAPYHRRVRGRTSAGPRPVTNASSGAHSAIRVEPWSRSDASSRCSPG